MTKNYGMPVNRLCLLKAIMLSIGMLIISCSGNNNNTQSNKEYLADGKKLAAIHCSSCHQLPDPSLLDSATWETGIMPAMAPKFGFKSFMGNYLVSANTSMSKEDWYKILAYYKNTSPKKLIIPKPTAVKDWAIFSLRQPQNTNRKGLQAMTTMVAYNPNDNFIYTGNAGNNLYKWNSDLQATLVKKFQSPVTDINFFKSKNEPNGAIITCIGFLPPSDALKGKLININLNQPAKNDSTLITDSLPRPVKSAYADFNRDGLTDYVSCGFGRNRGGLYVMQQQAGGRFTKKILRALPGATQVFTGDFNHDGWPDIVCLFAQADEGIWMFLNDKKGGFTSQNLLRFPSVYGSSSFQLIDFNHDGLLDIVYTCGDNNDFSPVFKPYHGVYIFTNQGNWKFKQTYFYHINGCSKAIAADFDHDGDLDIAVIAFFPDFKYYPEEGFTYHEQTTPGKFKVHALPINQYGRWIAMDINDIDHDGYPDIILGNFSFTAKGLMVQKDMEPNWDLYQPFIVLHNDAGKRTVSKSK
ncbi:VCBS repeat-containing protein [Mucilaginibacter sp. HC2]|uniref:FG-GAP-like repeat-containing protein n=1 Tax=Mucilaginibacter inviolabilis TaxID=2714892 RepID=UPI00140B6409|nr:FG-GAP-like repeat-containing protein [Mucilaginibacter inviolabilis]NHA04561.1 VCBS repeat-containing protein [Mucilaginibacter inviolabilis]